jgi:hypothetical protein
MHLFPVLAEYWWAVVLVMLLVMGVFIVVAGRRAEGGFSARHGWSRWMALSQKAANLQARIILTIFYFTVAAPFGVMRTVFGDPLRVRRSSQPRTWLTRQTRDLTIDDARRQF